MQPPPFSSVTCLHAPTPAPKPTTAPTAAPKPTAPPTAAPKPAAKSDIILWTLSFDPFAKHQEKLIKTFQEKNPNITIKLERISDYWAKTPAAYAAGTEPDTIYHMGQVMFAYVVSDRLLPMTKEAINDLTGGKTMEETFFPAVLENWVYKGKYYGVPEDYNYEGFNFLAINLTLMNKHKHEVPKAWLDSGPSSYAEVLDFAKKITIKQGNRVQTPGLTSFNGWNSVKFWSLNFQQGFDYRDYEKMRVKYDTEAGRKALQTHYDGLFKAGVDSFELGVGINNFIKDANAFMGIGAPHWGPKLRMEQPAMEWVMVPFPPLLGDKPYFSAAPAWGYWASKSTKFPEAVFKWFAFAGEVENQREMAIAAGMVPPRKALVKDPKVVSEQPQAKFFGPAMKIIEYGKAVPWFGALTGAFEKLYDTECEAFFAGKVSLEQALKNAEANTNKAIADKMAALKL
ncbi:MAG: extracellular solute-binding protein [Chloroflexi bacterium]|nr:extracellular solute-binding protein [Chloroflexota bacterium]